MIHIVFNESEVDLMKQVIELDETLAGEVVLIRDDFAMMMPSKTVSRMLR